MTRRHRSLGTYSVTELGSHAASSSAGYFAVQPPTCVVRTACIVCGPALLLRPLVHSTKPAQASVHHTNFYLHLKRRVLHCWAALSVGLTPFSCQASASIRYRPARSWALPTQFIRVQPTAFRLSCSGRYFLGSLFIARQWAVLPILRIVPPLRDYKNCLGAIFSIKKVLMGVTIRTFLMF